MYKKNFFTVILVGVGLLIYQTAYAQNPPKREMRANWLTTVWRIDWPSVTVPANGTADQRQTAINKQKAELINILDKTKAANMNTIFFQIRSMCDAMYPSSYENWSQYISSERGADPGWDPLAFAVEESHKRGLELHAWINPYRYCVSAGTCGNLSTDYINSKPEWLLDYGENKIILNPGIPEVINRIADIVEEVITNYDVDGIVFDDYFYVNGKTSDAHDQLQYDLYNPNKLSRADWRRENCNRMVKAVYDRIQIKKPWITFGVSPAGVAATDYAVARKYGVTRCPVGFDWQYDGIYSDPLAWLSQGSLDYISPQIYWPISGNPPYDQLVPWWSKVANKFGKYFYSSHPVYKMTIFEAPSVSAPMMSTPDTPEKEKTFRIWGEEVSELGLSGIEKSALELRTMSDRDVVNSSYRAPTAANFGFSEIGDQVNLNRTSDLNNAPGSVFYRTKDVLVAGFVDYLKREVFSRPAIQPAVDWKEAPTQNPTSNIAVNGTSLTWSHDWDDVKYAIYAVPNSVNGGQELFETSDYLLGVSYSKQFTLPTDVSLQTHKITVSVLDRYRNETFDRVSNNPSVFENNQITAYLDQENKLHVQLSDVSSDTPITAKVYSITGALKTNTTFNALKGNNYNFTINLQNYSVGVYVLRIDDGNNSRMVKFMKRN